MNVPGEPSPPPSDQRTLVLRPITKILVDLRRSKSGPWRMGEYVIVLAVVAALGFKMPNITLPLELWWLAPLLLWLILSLIRTERRLKRLEEGLIETIVELRKLPLQDNEVNPNL